MPPRIHSGKTNPKFFWGKLISNFKAIVVSLQILGKNTFPPISAKLSLKEKYFPLSSHDLLQASLYYKNNNKGMYLTESLLYLLICNFRVQLQHLEETKVTSSKAATF